MNIPAIRKLVADEYTVTESDAAIPKCSTQFTFAEDELLIRIPIYECQQSPMPALGLICGVLNLALPTLKKKRDELSQDLLMAMEGKEWTEHGVHFKAIVQSTSFNGGKSASAVTEIRIRVVEAQENRSQSH